MIRGINSQPYLNLDPFLDMDGFKRLHNRICQGIVMTNDVVYGSTGEPGDIANGPPLRGKPIFQAIKDYNALPYDHEIRVLGRQIGELSNRTKFIQYLKLTMGAYDPYIFIFLKDTNVLEIENSPWNDNAKYFPELCAWIDNLVTQKIIKRVARVIIFRAEHDAQTILHRDLVIPHDKDYYNHRHEFIHLRTNLDRPFYMWDPELDKYVTVTSHATFFNDQDWHAGGTCVTQTFSIRIDTEFTDEFREKIGLGNVEFY